MIDSDLKPCPCCGGRAEMLDETGDLLAYYGYPTYYVKCENCGLRTQYGKRNNVAVIWNNRTGEQTIE